MKILLSNDDGILAPGLMALYSVLTRFGDVHVVAPESPQSATGHGITVTMPLIVNRVHVHALQEAPPGSSQGVQAGPAKTQASGSGSDFYGYSVGGRPADCVKLAIRELTGGLPDLVVSGINAGANVGVNVIYSGTVAAAVEGAFFGLPAIAFSQQVGEEVDFDASAELAGRLLDRLIKLGGLTSGRLLNVNFPKVTPERPRPLGVRVVEQSTAVMQDVFERRQDPRGRTYYWIATPDRPIPEDIVTDATALEAGYVTVTPLQFNLTHRGHQAELGRWDWGDLA
jgi:5'-nucleotidase